MHLGGDSHLGCHQRVNVATACADRHRVDVCVCGPQVYTSCRCVANSQAQAVPGHCPNSCPHLLLPVMLTISLAGLIASLSHNPIYMMVLRYKTREHSQRSHWFGCSTGNDILGGVHSGG